MYFGLDAGFFIHSSDISIKGLVDLEVEIAKCEKKLDLAQLNMQKIVKVESQADYEETVPATVRLANEDKVGMSPHLRKRFFRFD
jgi:hypothetical protein